MRPRGLGTACKLEVWLADGKNVVVEVSRVDLLHDLEEEAVLEVIGDYWTGSAHKVPTIKAAGFTFVSRAVLHLSCSPLAYYNLNKLVVESITNLFFSVSLF